MSSLAVGPPVTTAGAPAGPAAGEPSPGTGPEPAAVDRWAGSRLLTAGGPGVVAGSGQAGSKPGDPAATAAAARPAAAGGTPTGTAAGGPVRADSAPAGLGSPGAGVPLVETVVVGLDTGRTVLPGQGSWCSRRPTRSSRSAGRTEIRVVRRKNPVMVRRRHRLAGGAPPTLPATSGVPVRSDRNRAPAVDARTDRRRGCARCPPTWRTTAERSWSARR